MSGNSQIIRELRFGSLCSSSSVNAVLASDARGQQRLDFTLSGELPSLRLVEDLFPSSGHHEPTTVGGYQGDRCDLLCVGVQDFLRHTGGAVKVTSLRAVLDLHANLLGHG